MKQIQILIQIQIQLLMQVKNTNKRSIQILGPEEEATRNSFDNLKVNTNINSNTIGYVKLKILSTVQINLNI